MHADRLNFLSVMSIESDILIISNLSFNYIIDDFAGKRSRKVHNS